MFTFKIRHSHPAIYTATSMQAPVAIENSLEGGRETSEAPVFNPPTDLNSLSTSRILRLELFVLVVMSSFGYFAWRTVTQEKMLNEVSLSQDKSLLNLTASVANGNAKVNALTHSVEAVTAVLAQSTSKMGEFSDLLGQRRNELQSLDARIRIIEFTLRKSEQARPHAIDAMRSSTLQERSSFSRAASPSNPHEHSIDMSIPMPDSSVAHHNFQGEVDYWLVPRMFSSGARMVKVQPYGANSLGIKVHSIDDGMDYILTPQGSWMEAL
jgi:hypothetical protein